MSVNILKLFLIERKNKLMFSLLNPVENRILYLQIKILYPKTVSSSAGRIFIMFE